MELLHYTKMFSSEIPFSFFVERSVPLLCDHNYSEIHFYNIKNFPNTNNYTLNISYKYNCYYHLQATVRRKLFYALFYALNVHV